MRFIVLFIYLFSVSFSFAQEKQEEDYVPLSSSDFILKAFVEAGRFNIEEDGIVLLGERYYHRLGLHFGVDKKLNSVLSSHIEGQWVYWRSQQQAPDQFHLTYVTQDVIFRKAYLRFDWNSVQLSLGLIDYKYSSSNLFGEYLYRSRSYPTVIYTSQTYNILDKAAVSVLGASLDWNWFNGRIHHSFNAFFETELFPIYDFTPSYHLYYKDRFVKVGGAISWDRLIHFKEVIISENDPFLSNPPSDFNYQEFVEKSGIDDFSSTKISFQTSLDLGHIFNLHYQNLNGEAFSLYGELAILGLTNHAPVYSRRLERTPIMAGVNLPLSNLSSSFVDLFYFPNINFEVEYLKNPYHFDVPAKFSEGVNNFVPSNFGDDKYTRDDWKWSLLLTQHLVPNLNLKLKVASDHSRYKVPFNKEDIQDGKPLTHKTIDYLVVIRLEWTN